LFKGLVNVFDKKKKNSKIVIWWNITWLHFWCSRNISWNDQGL